jgi:uncharacterized protein (TIGR02118 family)
MYRLTVCYGRPTDPAAFDKHYAEVHVPLASKIPGLVAYNGSTVRSMDKSEPAYYYVTTLDFATADDLKAGVRSPEMGKAVEDVPAFATGGVTMFSQEVKDLLTD